MRLPSERSAARCFLWRCISIYLPNRGIISAMTQTPATEPAAVDEPKLPESVSDVTRGPTPKIQPALMGFVLAAIIGTITMTAFLGR
jgi:hypothetical protein